MRKSQKRMMQSPTPETISILSFPHELLLSCIARLSRLYYPTLSLVSKRFRSLMASPELYKARSLLDLTESCLYVCIKFHRVPNPTWFTLCLKPDQTLTNCDKKEKKSSAYVLSKVPILSSPPLNARSLVSVGSSIYSINSYSQDVSVLDCRSHTWLEGPSLPVQLQSMTASALDCKIYVAGCYKDDDDDCLKNLLEVLDTRTGIWDHVPYLGDKNIFYNSESVSIGGKFHVKNMRKVTTYDPMEGKWDSAGDGIRQSMLHLHSYCAIGDVLYSVFKGAGIRWYDTKVSRWRLLTGLNGKSLDGRGGLPKFRYRGSVRLAEYGGNLVVISEKSSRDGSEKVIWFAVIALVKGISNTSEVLGMVKWVDRVLTLPLGYDFVNVFSATL